MSAVAFVVEAQPDWHVCLQPYLFRFKANLDIRTVMVSPSPVCVAARCVIPVGLPEQAARTMTNIGLAVMRTNFLQRVGRSLADRRRSCETTL